jgi:hypothetical protein
LTDTGEAVCVREQLLKCVGLYAVDAPNIFRSGIMEEPWLNRVVTHLVAVYKEPQRLGCVLSPRAADRHEGEPLLFEGLDAFGAGGSTNLEKRIQTMDIEEKGVKKSFIEDDFPELDWKRPCSRDLFPGRLDRVGWWIA